MVLIYIILIFVRFDILVFAEDGSFSVDIAMPGISPVQDENYMCSSFAIPTDPSYIIKFTPVADASRVHHMLLYGCESAMYPEGQSWNCLHHSMCGPGSRTILYAWARNAPPLDLPKWVGVPLGQKYKVGYFVLQIHYAKKFVGDVLDYSGVRLSLTPHRLHFLAGIYLFASMDGPIPGDTPDYRLNMSCQYDENNSIVPFAYRTHAHDLSVVISAFRVRSGNWSMIGKGNPHWPQMFYAVTKDEDDVKIKKGDILAAQCLYNSTGRHRDTNIGATGADEMCNFYMYYYTKAQNYHILSGCSWGASAALFTDYPAEGSAPMPLNPELEAHGSLSPVGFGVTEVPNWPAKLNFGQIGGLAVNSLDHILVFHRASRQWVPDDFDDMQNYQHQSDEPIMEATLYQLYPGNGSVISRSGEGKFFIPHGIHVDSEDNIWVTDVALHQVFKYPKTGIKDSPLLELGREFKPGSDETHFCKPSAVAVIADGTIFVADGYCNNRIVSFSPGGTFIAQWGAGSTVNLIDQFPPLGTFSLPHDLSIDESRQKVYVADRENGRVQVMSLNGTFVSQIHPDAFGPRLFAVTYSKPADMVFAVNGPDLSSDYNQQGFRVFAFNPDTNKLMYSWGPTSQPFQSPHAIVVSYGGRFVYVGELSGNLWKFNNSMALNSAINGKKKPGVSGDNIITIIHTESTAQLILIISAAIAIPMLLIILVCLCVRFRKQGGFRRINMSMNTSYRGQKGAENGRVPLLNGMGFSRSHKGFQPLSTEDIDAVDDITDESDNEDTIYPIRTNTEPLRA